MSIGNRNQIKTRKKVKNRQYRRKPKFNSRKMNLQQEGGGPKEHEKLFEELKKRLYSETLPENVSETSKILLESMKKQFGFDIYKEETEETEFKKNILKVFKKKEYNIAATENKILEENDKLKDESTKLKKKSILDTFLTDLYSIKLYINPKDDEVKTAPSNQLNSQIDNAAKSTKEFFFIQFMLFIKNIPINDTIEYIL